MAAEPMLWAMKLLPLLANDSQRVVLVHLSWRANPDGLLWPTVADMAIELGKSQRALRRTLKELDVDFEILNINADFRTSDGSQKSNYYQLLLNVTPQEVLKRRRAKKAGGSTIMSTSRKRFEARMERFYTLIDQWAVALSTIRAEINARTFDTWYAPLKFRGINKKTLVLGVPNEDFETYFKDGRSRKIILTAAQQAFEPKLFGVYFRVHK